MTLDSSLLHHFVRDALAPYSNDFRLLKTGNPCEFRLNGQRYSVHVSYIHDSGNTRDNEDEVRIQIARPLIEYQREKEKEGVGVAFVGFFEGGEAFVAWDPRHVFSLNAQNVVSVYARATQQEMSESGAAAVHQFKARLLGEESFAIGLPSSALGLYMENTPTFHALRSADAVQYALERYDAAYTPDAATGADEIDVDDSGTRQKFEYQRKVYPRDPSFRKSVLEAYANRCCVCGRALGLVEAAHIIPHAEPGSPNSVENGLALCVEHHRLYDQALLLPAPERELVFNEDRATYLRHMGQEAGLEKIEELSRHGYSLPEAANCYPSDEFLQKGIDIRLGK